MEDVNVYINKDGRVRAYIKSTGKTVSYPRLLMEEIIGRPLRDDEDVHHIDENPLNNDPGNLEIMIHGEHQRYHSQKYENKIATCAWCGKEFLWTAVQQAEHYTNRKRRSRALNENDMPFCSRQCSGKYGAYLQNIEYEKDGTHNSRRKLDDDAVRFIRENYIPYDKEFGIRGLARRFNVDRTVISYILEGRTYKNVI